MTDVELLAQVVSRVVEDCPRLSWKQRECLSLLALGLSQKEMAEALSMEVKLVQNHLQEAYVKLGLSGRGGSPSLKFMGMVVQELLRMAGSQGGSDANE